MSDGLAAVGVRVKLDRVGRAPFDVTILWVEAPCGSIEESETWLYRLIVPMEETCAWASDVAFCLDRRRRDYPIWTCSAEALDALLASLPDEADHAAIHPGPRFGLAHLPGEQRGVFAFARSAAEVLLHMPGVEVGGELDRARLQQWAAIDVVHREDEVDQLRVFAAGLTEHGLATCGFRWREGRSMLLTVDVGSDFLDDFEPRLESAVRGMDTPWRARFRPWSWHPTCFVYRHAREQGWQVREWLEGELGAPVVDSLGLGADGIALKVPVRFVDSALSKLRAEFGW